MNKEMDSFKEFCERTDGEKSSDESDSDESEKNCRIHYVFTSKVFLREGRKPSFSIRREWFYEDENENLEETTEPQKIELVNELTGSNLLITKVEETRLDGKKTNADVLVDSLKGNVAIQTRFINHPVVKDSIARFIQESIKDKEIGYWKKEDAVEILEGVIDSYLTNDIFTTDAKNVVINKMEDKFGKKYKVKIKDFAGFLKPEETRELTKENPMFRLDEVGDKRLVRKDGNEESVDTCIWEILYYLEEI